MSGLASQSRSDHRPVPLAKPAPLFPPCSLASRTLGPKSASRDARAAMWPSASRSPAIWCYESAPMDGLRSRSPELDRATTKAMMPTTICTLFTIVASRCPAPCSVDPLALFSSLNFLLGDRSNRTAIAGRGHKDTKTKATAGRAHGVDTSVCSV
ncbi:hypothetical protein PYCCODRAFT_640696 [Trametes coccinea BRFM310]|uniref:Uncharacterized protein n=1 Tax=Trametes coccinea (strain BRFM310) TaxID=1353009 RepID=A0A1Y2II39_TRAC3|nr:hypothetical protein PYCCODRAFT_640696 [Trametes coccinea BRFM310]